MGLLSVFKRNRYPKGHIAYFGLSEWWLTLTKEQRESCRKTYEWALNLVPDDMDITDFGVKTSNRGQTRYRFLIELAGNIVDDSLKIPLIEWSIRETLEADDRVDLHFAYMNGWKHYKLLTKADPSFTDSFIDYLQKDIAMHEDFVAFCESGGLGKGGERAKYPAFKELALIYERLGRYQDA